MNIIFDKPGKYKNDNTIIVVTVEHVEAETVFNVFEENATNFIKASKAHLKGDIKPDEKPFEPEPETDINKMTVAQLEEFAAGLEPAIDLSGAKNKAEKLEVLKTEIDKRKAELEAGNTGE